MLSNYVRETTYPRRGWTAATSFTFQAMLMMVLVLAPALRPQAMPRVTVTPPLVALIAPMRQAPANAGVHSASVSPRPIAELFQPPEIPRAIGQGDDNNVASAPDVGGIGNGYGRDLIAGIAGPLLVTPGPPPPRMESRPLRVSRPMESELIRRVQPVYPALAIQTRTQGRVVLYAVISREGKIENLRTVSGPPLLVPAAVRAVQQWLYRPYTLNGQPVEVDTEITVDFRLTGS